VNAIDGVYGAKLTGAGFGGCVVVLVDADRAEDVEDELQARTDTRGLYRFYPADGALA